MQTFTRKRPGRQSRLDKYAQEIAEQLSKGVPKRYIARRIGCHEITLWRWLRRRLEEEQSK